MLTLDTLAEQHIREAQARGEFDNLPGAGAPLTLEDDALVPEDLRAAYRILKNAGFVPPELDTHCEIRDLEQMLQVAEDDGRRSTLLSRINFLLTRNAAGKRRGDLRIESAYFEKIDGKLDESR